MHCRRLPNSAVASVIRTSELGPNLNLCLISCLGCPPSSLLFPQERRRMEPSFKWSFNPNADKAAPKKRARPTSPNSAIALRSQSSLGASPKWIFAPVWQLRLGFGCTSFRWIFPSWLRLFSSVHLHRVLRAFAPGDIGPTALMSSHFKPVAKTHFAMARTLGDMGLE